MLTYVPGYNSINACVARYATINANKNCPTLICHIFPCLNRFSNLVARMTKYEITNNAIKIIANVNL